MFSVYPCFHQSEYVQPKAVSATYEVRQPCPTTLAAPHVGIGARPRSEKAQRSLVRSTIELIVSKHWSDKLHLGSTGAGVV